MEKFKRYYNQNRKQIWMGIIIIASILILIQLLNGFTKQSNKRKIEEARANAQQSQSIMNSNIQEEQKQTNATSEKYSNNKQMSVIESFINYCNNKELDKAYEMVSNECKDQMFKNIETFERIYYSSTFDNQSKKYTIEKWANDTFIVTFKENALSVGRSTTSSQKIDYITPIIDENNEIKLNINSYVNHELIEKTKEQDGIRIEVENRNTYMNYDEFTVKVTNNTDGKILLDTLDMAQTLYILDTNGNHYPSYNNELDKDMLTISSGNTKKYIIKFYSNYISSKKIKSLVFSNIQINDSNTSIEVNL